MKKWENKKHSSVPKSITERTMFLKMQNYASLESLRISTAKTNKKMSAKFHQKLDLLAFLIWIAYLKLQ